MARFSTAHLEDANETLSKLCQTGNFRYYLRDFEKAASRVPHWPPEALMGVFMAGLKLELSGEIRMFKPRNLQEAINLASKKDEQLRDLKSITSTKTQIVRVLPAPSTVVNLALAENPKGEYGNRGRLSDEEVRKRRAQGLCFTCNEKYVPNHVCPQC